MYRVCDLCGGVDDHPRHSFAGAIKDVWSVNEAVRAKVEENVTALLDSGKITVSDALRIGSDFNNTASTDRHIDCCAQDGCPLDGTVHGCSIRAAEAKGGTGKKMVDAVMRVREQHASEYAELEA